MYNSSGDKDSEGNKVGDPVTNHDINSAAIKIAAVWTGTLYGIKLSDLVLLATLLYTVLQIGVLINDRIVKPWRKARKLRALGLDSTISNHGHLGD